MTTNQLSHHPTNEGAAVTQAHTFSKKMYSSFTSTMKSNGTSRYRFALVILLAIFATRNWKIKSVGGEEPGIKAASVVTKKNATTEKLDRRRPGRRSVPSNFSIHDLDQVPKSVGGEEPGIKAAIIVTKKNATTEKPDRRRPGKRSVPSNFSIHDLDQVPTCVFSRDGGWGNNVYMTLWEYIFIITQQDSIPETEMSVPCIEGFYRFLFGSLFTNLRACLETQALSKCFWGFPEAGWNDAKRDVHQGVESPRFKELLKLNKTAVDEVFARGCPDLLYNNDSYCGAHVRFGDSFFRNKSSLGGKPRNRICMNLIKNNTHPQEACFDFVARELRESVCPNASMPIFLAADYIPFVDYFVKGTGREYPKVLTCSSDDVATVTHTHDLGLDAASLTDVQIARMLSDWLGIALAAGGPTRLFSSTFRETAALGFYAE
jgi:hypothetical protein